MSLFWSPIQMTATLGRQTRFRQLVLRRPLAPSTVRAATSLQLHRKLKTTLSSVWLHCLLVLEAHGLVEIIRAGWKAPRLAKPSLK